MLIVLKTEYLSSISDLNSDVYILYKLATLTHDGGLHKVKKAGGLTDLTLIGTLLLICFYISYIMSFCLPRSLCCVLLSCLLQRLILALTPSAASFLSNHSPRWMMVHYTRLNLTGHLSVSQMFTMLTIRKGD